MHTVSMGPIAMGPIAMGSVSVGPEAIDFASLERREHAFQSDHLEVRRNRHNTD